MKQAVFIFLAFALLFMRSAKGQSPDSLHQLKKKGLLVYYSSGHHQRAEAIALRVEHALSFYHEMLDFKPTVRVLILSAKDWNVYTTEPVVYGVPHYNENGSTLIVAAEDNAFWKSFLPPVNQLPDDLRGPIQATYSGTDGTLTMQPFFDLLAIHELGHAFHMQAGLNMQRNWMGELFVNILLHTYIAEREPELLPALTLFPQMVIGGGVKGYSYTSLQDIQDHYGEIARQHPKNYGWYQCRWHAAAATIYDTGGKQVLRKLWDALKDNKEIMSDNEMIRFLRAKTHQSIAEMVENWDRDTKQ